MIAPDRPDTPTFYALIGDIVGSRELPNRAEVQRRLAREIEALNDRLGDERLAAPLRLVAGDELQALLADPAAAVEIAVGLADALHPVALRWGLGAGPLDTDLDPDVSLLDGPCFHRARRALDAAADDDTWLRAEGFPAPYSATVSALFRLMGAIRSDWTETQARYVREVRGRLQKEVAERFDVNRSTVSRALASARFRDVREGERAARELLRRLAAERPEAPAAGEDAA